MGPSAAANAAECRAVIAAGSAWYAVLEVNAVYRNRRAPFRGTGLDVSISPGSTNRLAHVARPARLPTAHVARGLAFARSTPSNDAKASNTGALEALGEERF